MINDDAAGPMNLPRSKRTRERCSLAGRPDVDEMGRCSEREDDIGRGMWVTRDGYLLPLITPSTIKVVAIIRSVGELDLFSAPK